MIRSWRLQTLTGGAQPLFGDLTTALVIPPTGRDNLVNVTVADTTLYQNGDRLIISPLVKEVAVLVQGILSPTVLQCEIEGNYKMTTTFPVGTILAVSMACTRIMLQAAYGSVNAIWVGSDNTITNAGLGNVTFEITPNIPFDHNTGGPLLRTTDYWMAAPAGTQGIASFYVL